MTAAATKTTSTTTTTTTASNITEAASIAVKLSGNIRRMFN